MKYIFCITNKTVNSHRVFREVREAVRILNFPQLSRPFEWKVVPREVYKIWDQEIKSSFKKSKAELEHILQFFLSLFIFFYFGNVWGQVQEAFSVACATCNEDVSYQLLAFKIKGCQRLLKSLIFTEYRNCKKNATWGLKLSLLQSERCPLPLANDVYPQLHIKLEAMSNGIDQILSHSRYLALEI